MKSELKDSDVDSVFNNALLKAIKSLTEETEENVFMDTRILLESIRLLTECVR
jgi:hypothetical protein